MEILLIAWIACGIFAAALARAKGRSALGWLILGLLFGVFALIAAAGMPSLKLPPGTPAARDLRRCPNCAEMVRKEANTCRFCGHQLPQLPPDPRTRAGKWLDRKLNIDRKY
jgi:hypothetical protein